jgi:trimeric autotransporter adhesin
MFRSLVATAILGLVLATGARPSSSSLVYLTLRVGSFDSTVTVDPPSLQVPVCSATTCTFAYEQGTVFTLKALTSSFSPFIKWSGGCTNSGSTPVCTRRLVTNAWVGASFSRLTVHYGAGKGGDIQRDPQHGSCGDGCDVFGYHESVVFRATAHPGYHVDRWSGACEDGAWTQCTISNLSLNQSVYVSFARNDGLGETTLPVGSGSLARVSVYGQGTVNGRADADFRCFANAPCKIYPNKGSAVAVTAAPVTGWKFSRWTGRCAGSSSVCVFMNQPWPSSPVPTVQAVFVRI